MLGLVKLSSSYSRVEKRRQWIVDEFNTTSIQNGRQYLSLKSIARYKSHVMDCKDVALWARCSY